MLHDPKNKLKIFHRAATIFSNFMTRTIIVLFLFMKKTIQAAKLHPANEYNSSSRSYNTASQLYIDVI
jgi:phage-related protein